MSILSTMTQVKRSTTAEVKQSSAPRRRPIELQTENGFSIVRRCDIDAPGSVAGTEHCFVVRDPYGYELDITVDFTPQTVAEGIKRSCGRLTLESAFWINCAERRLADYLWQNDDYPPDGKITIDCLTPADVDSAQRWGTDFARVESPALSRFKARVPTGNGDGSANGQKAEPIKFVTENGFTITRLCESDHSIEDTPQRCYFGVTAPDGREWRIVVSFGEELIKQIQARRRRGQLAIMSKYWPVIAEKYLADFVWREDGCPPHGELRVEELSGDDLLLAAHWQEHT
ncbi:MAG TPA: hypothetical protein VE961_07385 [Pyrinomonadaceae bacterium]|nr:hypothetical protein [Pyrinomonadaceae bacterium]